MVFRIRADIHHVSGMAGRLMSVASFSKTSTRSTFVKVITRGAQPASHLGFFFFREGHLSTQDDILYTYSLPYIMFSLALMLSERTGNFNGNSR